MKISKILLDALPFVVALLLVTKYGSVVTNALPDLSTGTGSK